jgi:hypothetical protein
VNIYPRGGNCSGSREPDGRCRDAVLVHRSEPSPAFLGDATTVGGRFLSQAVRAMMRVPTLAAINAAELRLLQSKRNVRQSVDRTRSALRAAVVRPSTLVLVALLSGISAFLVSHLLRPAVNSVPNSTDSTIRAPSYSLVRTFVSMYGARVLACALQLGVAAWKQSGSRVNANMPSTSAQGDSTTSKRDH